MDDRRLNYAKPSEQPREQTQWGQFVILILLALMLGFVFWINSLE